MRNLAGLISDNPAVDYVPATVALGTYLGLHQAGFHLIRFADWATVASFHQTLVEAAAGLFGLVFAAVAILRALGRGRRLDYVQGSLGRQVTRNLMSVITALGLATLVTILAMALDGPLGHPTLARAGTVWVACLASVRMLRLIWIFGLLLNIGDRDAETYEAQDPGTASPLARLNPRRGSATSVR